MKYNDKSLKKRESDPKNGQLVALEGKLPVGVTEKDVQRMLQADLKRTGEGVIPRLQQIKILHAGALMFEMPPNEEGKTERAEEFEAIIIDHHPCNAWWRQSFTESGGGAIPDCASLDGQHGMIAGGDMIECATCPHNQWDSAVDKDGNRTAGKACKNMKRLHILRDGHEFPERLTLPPTSIREADTFFCTLLDKLIPMTSVRIKFFLEEAKSSQRIAYSRIKLAVVGQVSIERYLQLQNFLKLHLAQIRGQEIKAEEYETAEMTQE